MEAEAKAAITALEARCMVLEDLLGLVIAACERNGLLKESVLANDLRHWAVREQKRPEVVAAIGLLEKSIAKKRLK